MKALIEHMQHRGISRKVVLYWGARKLSDLYMRDWVQTQLALMPTLSFVPVLSESAPGDGWGGRTGLVHHAVMHDIPDMSDFQVYACGAPIVIESARTDFVAHCRLDIDEFFADAFTSEADKARP